MASILRPQAHHLSSFDDQDFLDWVSEINSPVQPLWPDESISPLAPLANKLSREAKSSRLDLSNRTDLERLSVLWWAVKAAWADYKTDMTDLGNVSSTPLRKLVRLVTAIEALDQVALAGARPDHDSMIMWFLLSLPSAAMEMEGWKTDQGNWSTKKLVAINCPNSLEFLGTKATMEFKPADGSKAVVGMTRYNLLTTREDGDGLDLQEDLALCHVFPLEGKGKGTRNRNGKRSRSGYAVDPRKPITHAGMEKLDQMFSNSTDYPILDVDDMDVQDLLFANQPSKHWQSFTKIYTKNPKLMYAACNHCNTMLKLKGGSSCGTGSLRHHNDSCPCKPKQEQLPDNISFMPTPSIAI